MVTALLHGDSRSGADRPRRWPFAVTGVLATGLVAAGIGIADAYQDQQAADDRGPVLPAVIVHAAEPTETPTSQPTTPATRKPPSPPTAKTSPPPKQNPPKQNATKQNATKRPASKTTKPSATKQRRSAGTKPSKKSDTSKNRSGSGGSTRR